ncbi:MAG: hypothetical protein ACLTYW_04175 [Collinsella sp.]
MPAPCAPSIRAPRALHRYLKAEALPGVVGILRAEDVPVNQVGHLIQDWDVMIARGDITRCVGDAIVLVVAEDEATLERPRSS